MEGSPVFQVGRLVPEKLAVWLSTRFLSVVPVPSFMMNNPTRLFESGLLVSRTAPDGLCGSCTVTAALMLPVVPPVGWTTTSYRPAAGVVTAFRLKLLAEEEREVSVVLSGARRLTVTAPIVLLLSWTVTVLPAEALNVNCAFCPEIVVVALTGGASTVIWVTTSCGRGSCASSWLRSVEERILPL